MSYIVVVRFPNASKRLQVILDEFDFAAEYKTEKEAEAMMKDHLLRNADYQIVEVDV